LERRRAHGQHHIGKNNACHKVHFVALDQTVSGLASNVRAGLVIGNDDFGRTPAELSAAEFDGELKPVTNINSLTCARSRQGAQ
jgi:hypothetical protein